MQTTTAKSLDTNDTRAIALIGVYAFYSGSLILLGIATPILRLKVYALDAELVFAAIAIALIGWVGSKNLSKSLIKTCFDNEGINYSWQVLVAIALFWLSLLLVLSLDLPEIVVEGLVSGMWAIAATTLIGIALRIGSAIQLDNLNRNVKHSSKHREIPKIRNRESSHRSNLNQAMNQLSVSADNEAQIIISPQALAQQPQQFRGLMCLVLSLFAWTILELPHGIAELVAIALASWGITSLSTWQVLLYPVERSISIQFSGIWGMASSFTVNLAQFSRLETIKLKEVDLQWLQFAGASSVITLPIAITENTDRSARYDRSVNNSLNKSVKNIVNDGTDTLINPNLIQTLTAKLSLAEHKVSRDILSAMNIILPQSVGALAGLVILGLGIILLIFLPTPSKMPLETTTLLVGSCLVSPSAGRLILGLVAPSTMMPEPTKHLPTWQIGTGLIIVTMFSDSQLKFQGDLLALGLIWLCCGIGCCILALSRRSPLITKRFY